MKISLPPLLGLSGIGGRLLGAKVFQIRLAIAALDRLDVEFHIVGRLGWQHA
jgi:hypothetical protein